METIPLASADGLGRPIGVSMTNVYESYWPTDLAKTRPVKKPGGPNISNILKTKAIQETPAKLS
jgi:hypothetical protein